jgi:predicted alpha/beta superfamily hydrolase
VSESQPATMMGGADRFLSFLRDELAPWLDGRHGADPGDATSSDTRSAASSRPMSS